MILVSNHLSWIYLLIQEVFVITSIFKPVVFIAVFALIVGSACALSGSGNQQVIVVTATPETPVATEAPTEVPVVPTATIGPADFFKEEFDNGLGNYNFFLVDAYNSSIHYDPNEKADVSTANGTLNFNLNDYYIYYYLTYRPFWYTDVRLDVQIDNYGNNKNLVSLICRYDKQLGWYEFNLNSGGMWQILYYDAIVMKGYTVVADGASTKIKMGKDSNTYTAICKGKTLSLYINGSLVKSIDDKNLDKGLVGLGISSFDSYPVIMQVPWFQISKP